MGYKILNSKGGNIQLVYTPPNISMGEIDNLPMTEAGEIILIGIKMTGSTIAESLDVKINNGSGVYFSNMTDLVNWMNETFASANSLHGTFNISADQYLNYSNPEEFSIGSYILESGIFSFHFSDVFA